MISQSNATIFLWFIRGLLPVRLFSSVMVSNIFFYKIICRWITCFFFCLDSLDILRVLFNDETTCLLIFYSYFYRYPVVRHISTNNGQRLFDHFHNNQYNAFWDDQRSERVSGPCTCEIATGYLLITCARHPSNRSLTVYQIWAQSVQPFSRSGTTVSLHVRTCFRTPTVSHRDTLPSGCLHACEVSA